MMPRTFMTVVMALSVALLPLAGSIAASAKAADRTAALAHSHAMMDDCCPDHAKPCDPGTNPDQSMACCAYASAGILNIASTQLIYTALPGDALCARDDHAASLDDGSPPFRPPRI